MPHPKTSIIDYRNARYQGHVDNQGNRHDLGILVDDDLSFYVSHWKNNLLNGQTLVYISHGKYIYGEWLNNEPNGINVFRTGDTVLVGEFQNGRIIGKTLAIFERYNIIALLQAKPEKDKFDVLKCGKLLKHDDLLDYIDMLDIGMPEQYFSLIKFVTSFISEENDQGESLIASPCDGQNCYFGYRDGLAIVFNSNNGVVSVGKHENKQVSGFGGKFDGKNIQEGNFEMKETIVYHKKRPTNQIYAIFQKMHKRSLGFKNQYFDSKVKTLGDLQSILRSNIQKIVNYNMKHRIDQATTQDLNDSLDYQNLDEEESIKCAQNRHNMYDKQPIHLKKTTSQYCRQEGHTKSVGKLSKPTMNSCISTSNQKRPSRILIQQSQNYSYDYNNEQTVRKTPNKQSTVSYAKKSPIRYRQEDKQVYEKPSRTKKYLPEPEPQSEKGSERSSRMSNIYQNADKSSIYANQINFDKNNRSSDIIQKIPKFGGLQVQETEKNHRKSTVQLQVEEYKKQLDKSRSRQKIPGQSLGKCLKRPNYEDIQDRRKRLLNQFKQLNDSNSNSKVSNVSDLKRTPHKMSVEIQISESSRNNDKKQILESPCMKEKIISFNSQNDNATQNSEEGCLPLSLINNEKLRSNKNRQEEPKNDKCGSAFVKKSSIIQNLNSSYTRSQKQNISYTPSTFAKYKKDLENIKVEMNTSDRRRQVKRFYCRQSQQQVQPVAMSKKSQSNHWLSQNQEEEQNQFKQIKLRHQVSQQIQPTFEKRTILDDRSKNMRDRIQSLKDKEIVSNIDKKDLNDKSVGKYQRDISPIGNDLSRRKVYKYYFDD